MSNPIKAVIFDKDGTLHDTEKVFVQAWHLAAAEFDVPDMESTIRDCTGMPLPGIERYWNAKYPSIPFADYIPRRQYYFNEIIKDGIPLKEGCIEVLTYLREHGYRVGNADVTIVAQKPKLAALIPQMRENLVAALGTDAVNVKATTTERMGFEGEEIGISSQAVALLVEA